MSRLAVLLRAVNVGGTGRLSMAELKTGLAELGYAEPATLGAAGTAVVGADEAAQLVEARLERQLSERLSFVSEVFVRDGRELRAVLAANPFDRMAAEQPSRLLVLFLKGEPEPAAVEALHARIVGPEEIAPGPRCLFVAYGAGMGRSKLTPVLIERSLALRGTGRNLNTVRKLAELVG